MFKLFIVKCSLSAFCSDVNVFVAFSYCLTFKVELIFPAIPRGYFAEGGGDTSWFSGQNGHKIWNLKSY